jgi:hypothetical protein
VNQLESAANAKNTHTHTPPRPVLYIIYDIYIYCYYIRNVYAIYEYLYIIIYVHYVGVVDTWIIIICICITPLNRAYCRRRRRRSRLRRFFFCPRRPDDSQTPKHLLPDRACSPTPFVSHTHTHTDTIQLYISCILYIYICVCVCISFETI